MKKVFEMFPDKRILNVLLHFVSELEHFSFFIWNLNFVAMFTCFLYSFLVHTKKYPHYGSVLINVFF